MESREVDLSWTLPTSPNGKLQQYTVYIRNLDTDSERVVYSGTDLRITADVLPYTSYEVRMAFANSIASAESVSVPFLTLQDGKNCR